MGLQWVWDAVIAANPPTCVFDVCAQDAESPYCRSRCSRVGSICGWERVSHRRSSPRSSLQNVDMTLSSLVAMPPLTFKNAIVVDGLGVCLYLRGLAQSCEANVLDQEVCSGKPVLSSSSQYLCWGCGGLRNLQRSVGSAGFGALGSGITPIGNVGWGRLLVMMASNRTAIMYFTTSHPVSSPPNDDDRV